MSDIKIEAPALAEFARSYGNARTIIEEEMTNGVNRAAMAGEAQAKRVAPVKTGHLRRSITHTKASFAGGTATASYGTNVPYARWVEEGRGPVVAKGKALRFTIGGKVLFRKRVGPAKGKFYMRKSREWLEPQLNTEFRAVIVRILRRLGT